MEMDLLCVEFIKNDEVRKKGSFFNFKQGQKQKNEYEIVGVNTNLL